MVLTQHTCTCSPPDVRILRTIPVQTQPHYLAVDDDNDRIVVSGNYESGVDVLDGKGSPLSTTRPIINSQPAQCLGVFCNSSGIYLVVTPPEGTGQTNHYGPDGRFLDCLAQGLNFPAGMTLASNGEIVIAEWSTIKMYSKM